MRFAAMLLAVMVSACANGIEIPADATYMGDSEAMQAEIESWSAQGLGDASKCPAPYVARISTAQFEEHWHAIGGAAGYPSCGRGDGSVNAAGYCLGAYTEVDPDAAAHSSVIYMDKASPADLALVQHEIRHILYACVRGHGDPLHEDAPVWVGDVHAVAGQ